MKCERCGYQNYRNPLWLLLSVVNDWFIVLLLSHVTPSREPFFGIEGYWINLHWFMWWAFAAIGTIGGILFVLLILALLCVGHRYSSTYGGRS